jgi:predicted ATPase
MESIRIQNLRSIGDSGVIPIKNINILVGQNSSGKSTFLRTFPLLRQSIIRNTRGPILWYDDSLVDFGSYEESITRNCNKDDGIKFNFEVKVDDYSNSRFRHMGVQANIQAGLTLNVEIEIFETKKINYIKTIKLKIANQIIYIESNSDGAVKEFQINNQSMLNSDISAKLFKQENTGILPGLFVFTKSKNENAIESRTNILYFRNKCLEHIKKQIGNRLTNLERISVLISSINISTKESVLKQFKTKSNIGTWIKKTSNWTVDTPEFIEINNFLIAFKVPTLLRITDEYLKLYFGECRYIAPVRAKALRYYRRQDLSIAEVDAYGENMHMFLDNLNPRQKADYQNFVREIFGFTPLTGSSLGHITINIKDADGDEFNLADLGFGYSQVLPIITKLWFAFTSSIFNLNNRSINLLDNKIKVVTILIEQPELHLHPAMQAQLADAFIIAIEKAKEKGIQLKLIIETHSAVIINRIGRRIIEKKVASENVNVTLFDINAKTKRSIINTTTFNENGVLLNWPLGFFEPKN